LNFSQFHKQQSDSKPIDPEVHSELDKMDHESYVENILDQSPKFNQSQNIS
jgi:hypothetical protein